MPTGFPSRRQLAALPEDCGRYGYTGRYRPHHGRDRGCRQCWAVRYAWVRGKVKGATMGFLGGQLALAKTFLDSRIRTNPAPQGRGGGKTSWKDRMLNFAKGLLRGGRRGQ